MSDAANFCEVSIGCQLSTSSRSVPLPHAVMRQNRIIDLIAKQSIGSISSVEFKRRCLLNEMSYLKYAKDKTSFSSPLLNHVGTPSLFSNGYDTICCMEADPREGKCLLVTFEQRTATILNVSNEIGIFKELVQLSDTCNIFRKLDTIPHSAHWLWDGSVFTIGTREGVHFWDSSTCKLVESFKFPKAVLNHVIAAKKHSQDKLVAVSLIDGHVHLIDMRFGVVTMTMRNVEETPTRAIQWNPTNELQYVTGNDLGNMFVWDIRFQKKFVRKLNNNDSFAPAPSHDCSIIGINFYNYGTNIISVDYEGNIKTWNVYTGVRYPTHYDPVLLKKVNRIHVRPYHFATTYTLNQDVAFLPSFRGLRMFDINSGENLPNSNDIALSLNCLTFDHLNTSVYGACGDLVKVWKPAHKPPRSL